MNLAILSRNLDLYSTQSLARACVRRGHKVRVLDHVKCSLLLGQPARLFYERRRLEMPEGLIPRIGPSVTAQGARIVRSFELAGVSSTTSAASLLRARDKLHSLQYLAACGMAIPGTVFPAEEIDLDFLVDQLGGPPVVIKLLESTHGAGVLLAETLAQVKAAIDAFRRLNQPVLLQEYIAEAAGADLRVLVVAGEVVTAMKRQALPGEFRSNLHLGARGSRVELLPEEAETARQAVQALELEVAGVDLLRSRRGPLVLEVNASPGLEGIEGVTGVDVAGRMVEHLEQLVWNRRKMAGSSS